MCPPLIWMMLCALRMFPFSQAAIKVNSGSGDPKVSKGRSQTSSVLTALWSPPQRRNPCNKKDQHREKTTSPDAGQSRPSGATMLNRLKEQVGGASADAQSYWQGRFAACTFVVAVSFELVVRGTVGALPQTPQGTLSLDPARGIAP